MVRRWARRIERICCLVATYLPLVFVYGLTTWGISGIVSIGRASVKSHWLGTGSSFVGVIIYIMANWSYTAAVFTSPGSTTNDDGYGLLPTAQNNPPTTSFTVKSNGEIRYCKKCQARKPDRAHHCSTCRRCVLKMDHHCPWLATCVGLRNYKAFLLFLSYTTLLCLYAFVVSGTWVYEEIFMDATYVETLMPINYIVLSVFSGIISIVLGLFTGWHIMLSLRGQTTIECLETTRYLSPLRKPYREAHNPANALPPVAQQLVDIHTNALPGITRPEEGEVRRPTQELERTPNGTAPMHMSYAEREQYQSRIRYEEYLDEQDSQKLPNAFDLGWRRNMEHLLGPKTILWFLPICNTTGDGWSWEANPKWISTLDKLRHEREQQRAREINAGWGVDEAGPPPPVQRTGRQSKADKILGRDPRLYADSSANVPMQRLSPRGRTIEEELDDLDNELDFEDETAEDHSMLSREEAERRALNVVTNKANGNGNNPISHGGKGWTRGGASGMLRTGSKSHQEGDSSPGPGANFHDEGVD